MLSEFWSDLRYRLRALFRRAEMDRELDDELRDHLERETAAGRAAGMRQQEAARRARMALGGVEDTRERARDARGVRWVDILSRDLRLGVRSLRGDRSFTTIAVLSLAIGVAMSAGLVTVLQALYSGGLAFRNTDDVVALDRPTSWPQQPRMYYFSGYQLSHVVAAVTQLRDFAVVRTELATVRTDTSDSEISAASVTPSLPSLFGMRPEAGSLFAPGDGASARTNVVLISHDLWLSQFGGDPAAIGRALAVNGTVYTVVGVIPRDMVFPNKVKVWIARPLETLLADSVLRLQLFARMAPASTVPRIDAELTTIARADSMRGSLHGPLPVVRIAPLAVYLTDQVAPLLYFLGAIAIVLALIASVNFAALVLARGMRRREELGVRAALGASTSRLVTHMLTECALLGLGGGTLGALIAPTVAHGFDALLPGVIPPWLHPTWGLDAAAVAVCLAVALGVIFGVAPAIELARPAAAGFLRTGTGGAVGLKRQRSGRRALVTFQVFLAIAPVVFLAVAVGPALSFRSADGGIELHGLFSGRLSSLHENDSASQEGERRSQTLSVIRATPGVQAAAVSADTYVSTSGIQVDTGAGNFVAVAGPGGPWHGVSEEYFATLRPHLLAGRFLTDEELLHGAPVAVVSRHTATALTGRVRTGWRIRTGLSGTPWVTATVVGVVEDVVPYGFGEIPYVEVYSPLGAVPAHNLWGTTIWMRSAERPWKVVPAVYTALHAQVPDVVLGDLQSRLSAIAPITRMIRGILLVIVGSFAVSVSLAAIGIYGIVAYAAASRRKELAVRVALGAARMNVALLVTREAATQTLIGLALGVAGGVVAVRYFAPNPSGLKSPPTAAIAACCSVMLAALLLAAIIPVRRVWRTDTASVLRDEG